MSRGVQALATPSRLLYEGETLISPDLIENYKQMQKEKNQDLNTSDFIPVTMKASDDSAYVMSVIADKSLSTLVNRPQFRESAIGQATTKVEKNLKQEVILGSGAVHNGKPAIEHKLNFQVQAFQSLAQVRYEGFTNAALSYRARSSILAFEVSEKLPTTKEVVLLHEVSPQDRLSSLLVRWDW